MPRSKVDPETGLTEKQEKFCVLYVTDDNLRGNGTDCYLEAFKPKKAKRKTINERASRLLADSKIQARIAALRKAASDRAEISDAEILREVARLCFTDPRKVINEDGTLKPVSEWPDEMAAAIASIEVFEEFEGKGKDKEFIGFTKKIKFWDKNPALEKLMRHRGMFEKHNKQVTDPVRELLAAIDGRSKLAPPG